MGAPMMPVPMKETLRISVRAIRVTAAFLAPTSQRPERVLLRSDVEHYCAPLVPARLTLRVMRSVRESLSRRSVPQKQSATMPGPTWQPRMGET